MKRKFLILFSAFIAFLCWTNNTFAQTINLGTAADFVLFTTNGAITNTGITHLTGHVGSNVGGSTGFGNVDGVMHDQDPASAAATIDLNTAYLQLDAAVATFFPGISLGAGQTLNAGVYSIPGAATLNGTLFLDAQSDPTAVFIIQIEGTLGIGSGAQVVLLNGAQACKVYWKIEGQVSIAANVTMRGTIVANNAAISMNAGDSLEGRALSINGAIGVNAIVAYTPLGCLAPILMGPGNPIMGTTECFALFSGIGPVTNSGITAATGDVGTNSGLTTGFNPLFVTGTIHPVPDGATAQCATDFTVIYNNLTALPYDIELLYPAQFGNNLVLTPHVYLMNGAVSFTNNVYLNAQGNADAVFVIKINGAFGTSTFSNVILQNGAQAKNVYWVINGATSISDFSIFNGTLISQGAIDLLTGVTMNGRALTGVGAISTFAVDVIMPSSCAPFTNIEPTDVIVCDEQAATFTVVADGIGLSYQWRKGNVDLVNGGNISGANTATLTINPASILDQALDYNVVITGSFVPNDTSNFVSLTIVPAPTITSEPINITACVGDSISFGVLATGTGVTYQWRKGNIDLVNGGSISGATSDTLTINPTTLGDAGNDYYVVVSGGCSPNDTSIQVSLILNQAPLITNEPINVTACVGDSISFGVLATGTGVTYQWRKGNVDLVNGGSISGATSDTLTINPTTLGDAGNDYYVVVSGGCSPNDTSIQVSLILNQAPLITSEPINVTACVGDSISFGVLATGTGVTYQWRKGNVDLVNGGSISGATSDTLTINPTTLGDAGNDYYVVVSGGCSPNDTSIQVSLILNQAPLITSEPINVTACVGDSISFGVLATGTGVTYQWRKGNTDLVNGGSISGATSDTLTINPTTLGDAGNDYYVVISGGCSPNDTSIQVSLILNQAPLITSEPINITACVGDSISFGVLATGTGVTYQWRKGNADLVNGGSISGATSDTLTINPTTLGDAANDYYVVVSGGCSPNDTSIQVSLILNQAPLITSEPINVTACIGDSISFGVLATGTGVTYQWRKGNVDLVNGGSISGATSDTLTINPTTLGDAGNDYYVVVSGGCSPNDTSIQVSLILNQAPLITSEPINVTACIGDSISFGVLATGTGVTYQWRKGNVDLVNGGSISGATSATLSINPTTPGDAGSDYTVVITGTCVPSVTSVNVTLTLTNCAADLSVVKTASSLNPIIGETVVFTIVASNLSAFDATGVVVSELLQSGYSYTSSSTTTGVYDPISGNWTIGNLSAGGSETLTITAEVLSSGSYENTATITGLEPETDVSNNSSTVLPVPSDFFIPEGFSPNGDMVNDLFIIRGIFNFPSNSITIYNRWGNEVFSANPYQNTWDGKSTSTVNVGGDVLPVGTYFYVLDLGDGSKPIKGTIFLNN